MKAPTLAVSAAVAAICAGILVLFTDIEIPVVRWVNCGPLAPAAEADSEICRPRR